MEFVLKPRSLLPCSFPTELSPSCFPRFPVHPCCRFHLAPSQRSSPQAVSHGFPSIPVVAPSQRSPPQKLFPAVSRPSTLSSLPSRPLPTELSPSYFPRFPVRPPCRRFHLAPSQQSSPQAISHGFPSIPVVAPPQKLFPAVSRPSTLSSLPSRPLPTELSPSYFPRFPVRPSCRRFHLAPSQRSSPKAISHGFPSVHPVVASVSLRPRQSKLNENPSIGDAFGKNIYSTTIGSSTMQDKSFYYMMIICGIYTFKGLAPNRHQKHQRVDKERKERIRVLLVLPPCSTRIPARGPEVRSLELWHDTSGHLQASKPKRRYLKLTECLINSSRILKESVWSFDGKRTRKLMTEKDWSIFKLNFSLLEQLGPILLASSCMGEAPMSGRPPPANGAALLVARCCGVLDLSQSSEAFKQQDWPCGYESAEYVEIAWHSMTWRCACLYMGVQRTLYKNY